MTRAQTTGSISTIASAKGDIYTATADNTPSVLNVGDDGSSLVADSSATTGLRWQGSYEAGKNLIINGNMSIAQRGTSVADATTEIVADRFVNRNAGLGVFTASQETDAPPGFGSSMKWLCTTADAAPAAGDFALFRTTLEAQSLQGLAKGTASAKTTTVSFWVKSNVTGNFVLALVDTPNSRSIRNTYTISAADTWEKKTITFVGDTTGTLPNTNVSGIIVQFWLGAGSNRTSGTLNTSWASTVYANEAVGQTNLAATLNNYWMITGVQWEIGNVGTEFQLSAGTIQGELAACQRYYIRLGGGGAYDPVALGWAGSADGVAGYTTFPVPMRITPTAIDYSTLAAYDQVSIIGTPSSVTLIGNESGRNYAKISFAKTTSFTQYRPYAIVTNNSTSGYLGFSAEL